MYRFCAECGRPRWWPDPRSSGPCGHLIEQVDLVGSDRIGGCDASRLRVIVRRRGAAGVVEVQPSAHGSMVEAGDGFTVEARIARSGMIEIRIGSPAGTGPASDWSGIAMSRPVSLQAADGSVSFSGEIDLAVAPLEIRSGGEQQSLQGLELGVSVAVEPTPDGRLVPTRGEGSLRLLPREDNCLRALCLDATGMSLNGEPFAADLIRPGDIVGDGRYRWAWKGIERGFEPAASPGAFSISTQGLAFAGRVANFTVSFRSGELATVVGGSGSGKTTLVRMVAGILIPTGGSITVQAAGYRREYPTERLEDFAADIAPRVSYIPQDDAVLAELTVRQALEFAYLLHPSNRGSSRSSQALTETVTFLLRSTGLEPHAGKLVERLSGGQRRRVNLALGLVGDPDLVILDEPTTGLDFDNERRTMQLLRRLAQQGRAVIVVTHSMEAIRFADRCVVVQPGPEGASIAAVVEGRDRVIESESTIASLIAVPSVAPSVAASRPARERRYPRPRFVELVARGFRQWMNTPVPATLAFVVLPLVLGVMIRLGSGNFRKERLAIGLVAIFWLGVNQSVRDLLKDLDVIRREDLDGTSPTRQILARACFAVAAAAIGAVMMTASFHWLDLRGWMLAPDPMGQYTDQAVGGTYVTQLPWPLTILAFWAAGSMGGLFGLAIASACSFARRKAESIAVLASVLITLPQFLYSEKFLSDGLARDPAHFGYFFRTWHAESERLAELLSFLTVTRWTFLPLEAWMDRITDTRVYGLSGIMLAAGAIASVILAAGLLTISINIERGAGWFPRRRRRTPVRRA